MFGTLNLGNLSLGAYTSTKGGGVRDYLAEWIGGATYADYDAKKLDRMYQDRFGMTAVSASADKVGLLLDGAQWGGRTLLEELATQPELIANGTFDANISGWTNQGGGAIAWDPSGAIACSDVGGLDANAQAPFTSVVGRHYRFGWRVVSRTGGWITRVRNETDFQSGYSTTLGSFSALVKSSAVSNHVNLLGLDTNTTILYDDISIKLVPGDHGLNATSAQRLNLLVSGTRHTLSGDGTDDNLLTNWVHASAANGNTWFFDIDVPASVPAANVFFGAVDAPNFAQLVIDTGGRVCASLGSQAFTTVRSLTDFRGQRAVGAVTQTASEIRLFTLSGGLEYSGAMSDGIPTLSPRIGARNNAGAADAHSPAKIARIIPVRKGGLTLSDWQNIGPQLAAAGA